VDEPTGCRAHWKAQINVSPFHLMADGTPDESWKRVGVAKVMPSFDQAIKIGFVHGCPAARFAKTVMVNKNMENLFTMTGVSG